MKNLNVSITYSPQLLRNHTLSTIHTFAGNIIQYVMRKHDDLEDIQMVEGYVDYTNMNSVMGEYEATIRKYEHTVIIEVKIDNELDAVTIVLSY